MSIIKTNYELAKKMYEQLGVDVEESLKRLKDIKISIQCWQGDDVSGFLKPENELTGGIQVTGNYPGRARTPEELRADLKFALSLIPGHHKVNLHAIYLDTDDDVDLDEITPEHYQRWVDWAKSMKIGLDFNPTCFSHEMSNTGFTLSSKDEKIRQFWIKHCQQCRKVGEYFGRELGQKSVVNIWIPDGYKDIPVDRYTPRVILKDSLDQIFAEKLDNNFIVDAIESKLFGIGAEAYTTGSHEFYLGYAVANQKALCLDTGHFHPTEVISDKISSVLLFTDELLLHVSRPMRWDSDHVVILDDELQRIAESLIRNNLIEKTHIGLDYFDASISRVASWVIGARNMQKALLKVLLEPTKLLKQYEDQSDYTARLAVLEELKTYPYGAIYDYFCEQEDVKIGLDSLKEIKDYDKKIIERREK